MPMKLIIGLAKKIGQPEFGSLGAVCQIELELPKATLSEDMDAFHRQARHLYAACNQAIAEELARQQNQAGGNGNGKTNGHAANGHSSPPMPPAPNGNGSSIRRASQKQIEYVNQLAGRIKGLGVRRLEALVQKMFAKPLVEMTSLDASGLIDALKSIKAGQIDLEAVLGEPAA